MSKRFSSDAELRAKILEGINILAETYLPHLAQEVET